MKPRFTFQHVEKTTYHILEWERVCYVVAAFPRAAVVNKHLTALISKVTTNADRFEYLDAPTPFSITGWYERSGPHFIALCPASLSDVLDDISKHYENYLAKLILE